MPSTGQAPDPRISTIGRPLAQRERSVQFEKCLICRPFNGHGWARTSDLSRVKCGQRVPSYPRLSPTARRTGFGVLVGALRHPRVPACCFHESFHTTGATGPAAALPKPAETHLRRRSLLANRDGPDARTSDERVRGKARPPPAGSGGSDGRQGGDAVRAVDQ